MPNAYLQKVSDEQGIALTKLEEYWNKAKEIAKNNKDAVGEAYWKYVMGIFKNMAKLNNVSVSAAFESISKKIAKMKKRPEKPKKPTKPVQVKKPANKGKAQTVKKSNPNTKKVAVKGKAVKLPEWWVKKSEISKGKYIAAHPGSQFVKHVAAKNPKLRQILIKAQKDSGMKVDVPDATTDETSGNDSHLETDRHKVNKQIQDMSDLGKKASSEKPKLVIRHDPPDLDDGKDDDVEEMPVGGPSKEDKEKDFDDKQKTMQVKHKSIFHRAYFKARQGINHTLKRNKLGMHSVGKFLKGYKLTDNEKKHAKDWAGTAAKLVLGAAVGLAMFTPLAGMAPELGQHFMTMMLGDQSASESAESTKGKIVPIGDPDKFEPTDFTDRLHDWLMKQDIPTLVEQLKKEAEK